ncbi:MAG: carbohydrate kinase [Thiogranum sp.]|nr:carbohydrate kinase [Thiogranum sp.]
MNDTRRPYIFGEVLFDRFPDGQVILGGAPFNVAWHLQAFGQAPLFVSRIGDDKLGRLVQSAMQAWGLDTRGLQVDAEHATGSVEVTFDAGEPSYEILADSAYDHIVPELLPPGDAGLLYHGTLALRTACSAAALAELKRASAAPVLLDVNLRPPWWQMRQVQDLINDARWVKLNHDELDTLISGTAALDDKVAQLMQQHRIELLIVTRGSNGATAFARDGSTAVVQPAAGAELVDTVGAGDAFTSVIALGLLLDWPLDRTMTRAQQFASALVGVRGATVQDPQFYQRFLSDWKLS